MANEENFSRRSPSPGDKITEVRIPQGRRIPRMAIGEACITAVLNI